MTTQLIGFSMGGVVKRFLVSPPSMSPSHRSHFPLLYHVLTMGGFDIVWPANLVTCALFNTLHSQVYSGFRDTGMSRQRFFFLGLLASCVWCMCAPSFLFRSLLNI
jgi:hypothetical protein